MFGARFTIRNALIPALLLLGLELHCQSRTVNFAHLDISDGLSHNQVNCIYKDSRGFMWFGTMSGLNRFDGYTFKKYRHHPDDSSSINDSYINTIREDHLGRLWINTLSGLTVYDPETETFSDRIADYLAGMGLPSNAVYDIYKDREGKLWLMQPEHGILRYDPVSHSVKQLQHDATDSSSLVSNDISSFVQDQKGDFWVITHNGILQHINGTNYRLVYKDFRIYREKGEHWLNYQLFVDSDNDVWIYASNYSNGIYLLASASKTLRMISTGPGWVRLNNNTIKGIVQDIDGLIWIGTDHGGINLINKPTSSVEYLISNPYDSRSLNQNSITSLFRDDVGIIWAGTFKKGINYYHSDIIRFGLIKQQTLNPSYFQYDDINAFCEDDQGNLWIGTNGGGLIYFNRKSNTFTHYQHDPSNPQSLGNDVVISLYIDRNRKLWIGTFYGGLDYFDGRQFHHYRHDPADPESLADDRVWELYEDSGKRFWVGTLGGGLDLLNPATGKFRHYKSHDANSIGSDFIFSITEDHQHNLWIGTANGISILDKQSGIFRHIRRMPGNSGGLSNNNVIGILFDSRGWIWVGTREGLNLYDPKHSSFVKIDRSNGLADNTVLSILEDDAGNLWMATTHGLSNIVIHPRSTPDSLSYTIQNYDEPDGLQGEEFNERAACKTEDGELIFGGAQGFNIFRPQDININRRLPPIVFTGLELYNTPVKVNEKINGRVLLKRSIAKTDRIVLKSGEKMFSLEFAALDYFQPGKNRYKYRLEGFNNDWMESDASLRKATYTNLSPGSYIFRVIASNNDGTWNETGAQIGITVLPPLWKSRTAFMLYFLTVALLLFLLRYVILERERMKFRTRQEKHESERRHEILESRIKNLIQQRETVKKSFQKKFELTPSEIQITSLDEKLIQKAMTIVENNISNSNFSVDRLSKEIGMSRVHLYKKLTSLTGKSPIEFIRVIRLRRAARLLEKSQMSVAEIAYQVGFNNPKYFARYFRDEYHMLPSEYASKMSPATDIPAGQNT